MKKPLSPVPCHLLKQHHGRIELLSLNPDYDPIPVAPHEGPEMVVVGEWLASID